MNNTFFTKGIYSSNMVLQQNRTGSIFGKTASNSEVKMNFRNKTESTVSDNQGNWKIEFNPGESGGPFDLELISCGEKILFENVMVGEVWVSSGQSNAQLPLERLRYKYKDEFSLPENTNVRIITIPISYSFDGEKDSVENPNWLVANPENLGKLSGTSYFFAKTLSKELGVPVGIINASQGGSPIESWVNEQVLKNLNKTQLLKQIERWRKADEIKNVKTSVAASQSKWDEELQNEDIGRIEAWEKIPFEKIENSWEDAIIPGDMPDFGEKAGVLYLKKEIEITESEAEKLNSSNTRIWMGTIQDADQIWINGVFCGSTGYSYPPRRYFVPKGTFVKGKNTVTVRVQKNGMGPIRFFEEKPYFIFTEDVEIQPSITRNLEPFSGKTSPDGIKIYLSGKWKKCRCCEKTPRPGEMFFEWEPTALFNSMLAPAFNYGVSGALWYQGESNAGRFNEYKDLLKAMAGLWRQKFSYSPKNMPLIVAQLPNWADGHGKDYKFEIEDWAELRQSQFDAVKELENAALAVLIDAGEWNDLHPESKKTVGQRAAFQALRIAYSKQNNAAPYVRNVCKNEKSLRVQFECGTSELKAYKVSCDCADFNSEAEEVFGFELINAEGGVVASNAKLISKDEVEISTVEDLNTVKEVRYLWKNNPWIVNLYSNETLPAVPFKFFL